MKTQFYTAVSLDGFLADENHSLEWLFQFDHDNENSYNHFINKIGAIAMGSSTYEWMLKNYIFKDPENPMPWPYEQPVWVFSSRDLQKLDQGDIRFVKGDVEPVFQEMQKAAKRKNIWIVGGGDLASQFYKKGLLDELLLTIAPVILTRGARLFTEKVVTPPLRVLKVKHHKSGMVEINYEVEKSV